MSLSGLGLRAGLLCGLGLTSLLCPTVVCADEIRVLFVVPRDAELNVQVSKLERAIGEGHGPVALAESLSDAHVVVQFTEYRRSLGDKGQPLFHWRGQAKLLKQPEERTVSSTALLEHFELLVIGEDGRGERRALELLETMLNKALRPKGRKPAQEPI